ncbi:hypothetical protein J6590_013774 [Homalodisca vitripennis]|nr:hypothetical protein J6590_013774 [Homalodisca vitripennis]
MLQCGEQNGDVYSTDITVVVRPQTVWLNDRNTRHQRPMSCAKRSVVEIMLSTQGLIAHTHAYARTHAIAARRKLYCLLP